jgi:signal transduction histidine kinase
MGMRSSVETPAAAPDRRVRWAWAGFGLAIAIWLASLVGYILFKPDTSGDWGGSSLVANLPFLVMVLAFDVIGVLITTRRPGNAIGWLVLGIGLAWSAGDLLAGFGQYAFDHSWSSADVLIALSQPTWLPPIGLTGTFLILLFPDGHLPSPRWRWFAWTIAVGMTLVGIAFLLVPGTFEDSGYPTVSNPLGIEAIRPFIGVLLAGLLIIPIGMLGSAVALVQRYRRSAGAERQQMKWLAYAAAVAAFTYAGAMVASILKGSAPDPAWLVVWQNLSLATLALIPIAIGIAVLKYRLYDIDVVINKTIVFGALAAFIGAVYVAVVVLLGAAIGATTTNPALSIAATAIVALLFEPVRVRVQRVANRFVYGERATPYEVLSRFSDRIAGTYATEDVLPRTARVIAEGAAAERVDVWLRVGDVLRAGASWPPGAEVPAPVPFHGEDLPFPDADAAVPVRHSGEMLGAITVTKPRGETMTPAEAALLADLAGQAGLVLSNVRLTAELQARLDEIGRRAEELKSSRQRIVTTQDAERRRLERNIHDGAQQHLVALAVRLGLIRGMLAKDPGRAAAMLGDLRAEVSDAIETLSSLALGIYPPVLEELGIAAALESQARAGTLPVTVSADGVDRQPIETEAAVYFCCLEAIQNAAKYAHASRVDVRIGHEGANLTFEVRDDGVGFDPAAARAGSGLQGMADRLSALGGSVEITSTPGVGTVVTGRVPAVVFA